jgi:formamidopyrimidine-DNA glycosylase
LPELPEVEITRRHLEPAMVGKTVASAKVSHPRTARLNASAEELASRIDGRTVISIGRHGKFIEAALDDGQCLIAHLGMSGRFSLVEPGEPTLIHTHAVLVMDEVVEVRFIDPRTFGFIAVFDEDEVSGSPLARLGPDAWTTPPTEEWLTGRLAGRSAPIKALLLDQTVIAGLGNIYADEVLHLAGVHPLTPGGAVGPNGVGRLLDAVREVLTDAIDSGGTTLDDLAYLLPDGQAGENLERLQVYGRQGLPCPRCGNVIERVVVRGRSTHFCPKCQP